MKIILNFFTLFLTSFIISSAIADDVYQADKNILIISAVDVGDITYTDVNVQVQDVVSIGTNSIPNTNDIYNSSNNQLTIQSVTVGSSVYKNVVVTLGKIIGVGGSQAKYQAKKLSLSSYKNSKELDFYSNDFPKDSFGYNPLGADAQAFFYFKSGNQKLRVKITRTSYDFKNSQLADVSPLKIERVIPEGGKEMSYQDFLRGYQK